MIIKKINLHKHSILEMALNRSKYQDRIFNLMPQIVQNWCLCYYCKEYDEHNDNYFGWRKELIAHLANINSIVVKGDKYKWTYDEVIKDSEYDNIEVIRKVCEYKLDDEDEIAQLQDQSIRNVLYKSFSDNIEYIVSIMSDKESVKPKIDSMFPIPNK